MAVHSAVIARGSARIVTVCCSPHLAGRTTGQSPMGSRQTRKLGLQHITTSMQVAAHISALIIITFCLPRLSHVQNVREGKHRKFAQLAFAQNTPCPLPPPRLNQAQKLQQPQDTRHFRRQAVKTCKALVWPSMKRTGSSACEWQMEPRLTEMKLPTMCCPRYMLLSRLVMQANCAKAAWGTCFRWNELIL